MGLFSTEYYPPTDKFSFDVQTEAPYPKPQATTKVTRASTAYAIQLCQRPDNRQVANGHTWKKELEIIQFLPQEKVFKF